MAITVIRRRQQNLEALSSALTDVLNTIAKVKQERGRQELNSAVMNAMAGLGEEATSQQRMGAATGAVNRVRGGQGSEGILQGILSSFNPAVGTHYGTSPIEELMTRGAVQNMFRDPLADEYKRSLIAARAPKPEKELWDRLRQVGQVKNQAIGKRQVYTEEEFGKDQAILDQFDKVISITTKQEQDLLRRIDGLGRTPAPTGGTLPPISGRSRGVGAPTPQATRKKPIASAKTSTAAIGPPISLARPDIHFQNVPAAVGQMDTNKKTQQPPSKDEFIQNVDALKKAGKMDEARAYYGQWVKQLWPDQ